MTSKFVSLCSTLGSRYNDLVSNAGNAAVAVASKESFDDPLAVRNMFDNLERKKKHVWVLFANPLDDTLVWNSLMGIFFAILISVGGAFK